MPAALISRRILFGAAAAAFAAVSFAAAQQSAASATPQSAPQVRTAEQQYKNIQVLKGVPANQLILSMHVIESSLGVNCEYCHVPQMFDKDDLKTKQTARRMISMVQDINKNTFAGKQVVNCYTCHRGSPQPLDTIKLPIANAMIEHPAPARPETPSADQIIAKYVQAIGGEAAIRKVTSRVITASRDIPTGPGGEIPVPAHVEIYQKSPNLAMNISRTDKLTVAEGYDGTAAWAQNPAGAVANMQSPDQERTKRAADLYESLNLGKQYAKMDVRGIERVNGRETYVVVGTPANDTPEELYFDKQNGLLVRKTTVIPTLFGVNPVQVDYSDYRNTGSGVKIPFVTQMVPGSPRSELWTTSTLKIEKVQDNVPIDDVKFTKPASKPPAAQ